MCGIGGISLSPQSKLPVRKFAHQLLLHSEERGKVAAGYAYAIGDKLRFHKNAGPGGHLSLRHFNKDARLAIVHTRNATMGSPQDNNNNHPVIDPDSSIVLIHNGVVMNHEAIKDAYPTVAFAEVDSDVLPVIIKEFGFTALEHVDGWAAVAWMENTDAKTLHLARTEKNSPIVIAGLKDGSIAFASTFMILHASLIEVGYGDEIAWGFEVPEHTYLTIRNGNITSMQTFNKYSVTKARWKKAAKAGEKKLTYSEEQEEKKRLQAITDGATYVPPKPSVGYTAPKQASTPAHAPVGNGGYVSPYKGGTGQPTTKVPVTTTSYVPKDTPRLPAGEDPLAAITAMFQGAPTNPDPRGRTYSPSTSGGTVGTSPRGSEVSGHLLGWGDDWYDDTYEQRRGYGHGFGASSAKSASQPPREVSKPFKPVFLEPTHAFDKDKDIEYYVMWKGDHVPDESCYNLDEVWDTADEPEFAGLIESYGYWAEDPGTHGRMIGIDLSDMTHEEQVNELTKYWNETYGFDADPGDGLDDEQQGFDGTGLPANWDDSVGWHTAYDEFTAANEAINAELSHGAVVRGHPLPVYEANLRIREGLLAQRKREIDEAYAEEQAVIETLNTPREKRVAQRPPREGSKS